MCYDPNLEILFYFLLLILLFLFGGVMKDPRDHESRAYSSRGLAWTV